MVNLAMHVAKRVKGNCGHNVQIYHSSSTCHFKNYGTTITNVNFKIYLKIITIVLETYLDMGSADVVAAISIMIDVVFKLFVISFSLVTADDPLCQSP
jgi:hypothetical protein